VSTGATGHAAERADSPPVGRHRLGPHTVGQRVVLRRLLVGERGPSGGPAFSDVIGVCLAWGEHAVLRLADGTEVSVPVAEIVSGKPVPPRPSVRQRISAEEAQLLALAMWPQLDTSPLGAWTLRWSRVSPQRRANSVLAMAPAGVDDAVAAVEAHYTALGRRPIASVLPDSPEEEAFRSRGWVLESDEADSLFQLASVAMARRALRERPAYAVRLEEDGDRVVATVGADAGGLASLAGDWVGLRALEVAPARRRRGLGLAVVGALLDWGAERGATTAYLQVLADNAAALGLYDRLGFATHHTYRYLAR
jgi:GNAT superfamily N-acetyltransferase